MQTYTSYDEPKHDIALSGKRNIVGVKGKIDISEDYNKFDEIPSFTLNTDPSIPLNNVDAPWFVDGHPKCSSRLMCPVMLRRWASHCSFSGLARLRMSILEGEGEYCGREGLPFLSY
jgi:hypothetical protein